MIFKLECITVIMDLRHLTYKHESVVGMVAAAAVVYQTLPPTAITKFSLGLVSFISL